MLRRPSHPLPSTTMKAFALVSLLFVQAALAVPAADLQTVLGELDLSGGVFGGIAKGIEHAVEGILHDGKDRIEKWAEDGKEFVKQNGLVCEWLLPPMLTTVLTPRQTSS